MIVCRLVPNFLASAVTLAPIFNSSRTPFGGEAARHSDAVVESSPGESETLPARFVSALPPSLRTTALLVLTGHTKAEIRWLLRLSDSALRKRIAEIRRRWRSFGGHDIAEIPGLRGTLAFGRIRQTLLGPVRREGAVLASHDPDGHLFVLTSQNGTARQQQGVRSVAHRSATPSSPACAAGPCRGCAAALRRRPGCAWWQSCLQRSLRVDAPAQVVQAASASMA